MNLILRKIRWAKSRRILCVFVLLLIGYCLSVYAEDLNVSNVGVLTDSMMIIVGESKIVNTELPTIRVAVTDPKIADVKVLTPYQVMLQGLKVGSTDLIIWSEDEKEVQRWKVRVGLDLDRYNEKLNELFPNSTLQVSQSGEVLIVKGLLRSANHTVQLHDYLDKSGVTYVDMTSVAGVQQVQLQVRVAEVQRTALRTLGINAFHTSDDFFGAVTVGSSSGGALVDIPIGVGEGQAVGDNTNFIFNDAVSPGSAITILAGIPRADFEIFIQALIENQYLKMLANPTLVALSGEEATFLAGGEFPIPVVQGTSGGAGGGTSISIEYREFGVRLVFRPTVLGDGTIRLYAAPEVSELTSVGAVTIEGFEVPALITRKVATTLELKSGQTFAMAGLLQHSNEAVKSRVPGFGDLPVLGPLFRSVRYEERETELVILVTVSLVEPMSLAQVPPLPGLLHRPPDDWEFYLEGRIESKEPAKIHPDDAEKLKQMGLDELMGPGAWESYNQEIPLNQIDPAGTIDVDSVEMQEP